MFGLPVVSSGLSHGHIPHPQGDKSTYKFSIGSILHTLPHASDEERRQLREKLAVVRPALNRLRRFHDSGRPPLRLLARHDRLTRAVSGLRGAGEDGVEVGLWGALAQLSLYQMLSPLR
jgi:hypothetical protein